MTKDDEIIRMAREAGLTVKDGMFRDIFIASGQDLVRFAALVAQHEREACAKMCEDTDVEQFTHCQVLHDDGQVILAAAANAIRARGEVQG